MDSYNGIVITPVFNNHRMKNTISVNTEISNDEVSWDVPGVNLSGIGTPP